MKIYAEVNKCLLSIISIKIIHKCIKYYNLPFIDILKYIIDIFKYIFYLYILFKQF